MKCTTFISALYIYIYTHTHTHTVEPQLSNIIRSKIIFNYWNNVPQVDSASHSAVFGLPRQSVAHIPFSSVQLVCSNSEILFNHWGIFYSNFLVELWIVWLENPLITKVPLYIDLELSFSIYHCSNMTVISTSILHCQANVRITFNKDILTHATAYKNPTSYNSSIISFVKCSKLIRQLQHPNFKHPVAGFVACPVSLANQCLRSMLCLFPKDIYQLLSLVKNPLKPQVSSTEKNRSKNEFHNTCIVIFIDDNFLLVYPAWEVVHVTLCNMELVFHYSDMDSRWRLGGFFIPPCLMVNP